MDRRPRLAVWKFASCDGCQLSLLDCEDELLAVAEALEIASFPEASSAVAAGPYDLSLVEGSITTAHDAERMVSSAMEAFRHLDILFNNAGTGIRGMVHELEEEQWDTVIDINLKGVYQCSKAAIPIFLEQNSGNIINTASTFGLLASPRYAAYCASKGGVIMLTKQMALDYGPDIRVNCICPGATDTPRLRRNMSARPDPVAYEQQLFALNRAAGRLADPKEIAYAALFLASDESSFVTGSALVVDGGQTIDA